MRIMLVTVAVCLTTAACGGSGREEASPEFVAESSGGVAETSTWDDATALGFVRGAASVLAGDGEAAERRAAGDSVKVFAKRLATEQRDLAFRADSLAHIFGIQPSRPPAADFLDAHERAARDLQALTGEEFEQRFLEHVTEALEQAATRIDQAPVSGNRSVTLLLDATRRVMRGELEAARRLRATTS